MKGLILFRSYYGNTQKVAETMAGRIKAIGHEAIVQDMRRKLPDLNNIDFIIIGAPTRIGGVTLKAKSLLKKFKKRFAGKPVAVFDTIAQIPTDPEELEKARKWLYPGAAGIMYKRAKDCGLNVYEKMLRCQVHGLQGPLVDNELKNAETFAHDFISFIKK